MLENLKGINHLIKDVNVFYVENMDITQKNVEIVK